MGNITLHPGKTHVSLNRYFLWDNSLTLEEKGLLAFLMSIPDQWKFTKSQVTKYLDTTVIKFKKMQDRLIEKKYITIIKEDKEDYYCFSDIPFDKNNGTIADYTANIEQLTKLFPAPAKNATIKKEKKIKEYDVDSNEYRLAYLLYKKICIFDPTKKEPNLHIWAKTFSIMIWADKISPHQINEAIEWCFRNQYWRTAISSPERLKWSWGIIRKQMNNGKTSERGNNYIESEINDWLTN